MEELLIQQYQFAQYVIRNCKRTCSPDEVVTKIAGRLYSKIDEIMAMILQFENIVPACNSGCFYCCHLKVDTHPHEILNIVEYLRLHTSTIEIEGILSRAKKNREKILPMTKEQHLRANLACCLLQNNRCVAYPVRPAACRVFHAQNIQTCKASFARPDRLDLPHSQVEALRTSLDVVIGASLKALQDAGHDVRSYDLNSAIVEALRDTNNKTQWLAGAFVFSDFALVKE